MLAEGEGAQVSLSGPYTATRPAFRHPEQLSPHVRRYPVSFAEMGRPPWTFLSRLRTRPSTALSARPLSVCCSILSPRLPYPHLSLYIPVPRLLVEVLVGGRRKKNALVGLPLSEEPDGTVAVDLGDVRGKSKKGGHDWWSEVEEGL